MGATSLVNLDSIADSIQLAAERGQPIVWRPDFEPPEHTLRLMRTLGVRVEVVTVTAVSAHQLTETRFCEKPLCTDEAVWMSRFCRAHAPISELRPPNGHDGLAALEAMDAGEPQTGTDRYQQAPIPIEEARMVRPCRTAGCQNQANTRYSRGIYANLCEEVCIPAKRDQASVRASKVHAAKGSGRERLQPPVPEPTVEQVSLPAPVEAPPESAGRTVEIETRPDEEPGFLIGDRFTLALTGDFTRDAQRVRAEAVLLRSQADALDVIATGIEQLAETAA